MSVTVTADTSTDRRVRITLEGTARPLTTDQRSLLRVEAGDRVYLVDQDAPSVTVEDVQPQRTWTPGDVVAGDHAYTRGTDGKWRGLVGSTVVAWTDAEVEAALADPAGGMELLRYQATQLNHAEDD